MKNTLFFDKSTNIANKLATYGRHFMDNAKPDPEVYQRVKLFHTDSVLCGLSALALRTNAPTILRAEALNLPIKTKKSGSINGIGKVFGSDTHVLDYKAIAANCSAVREWDSNGTVFGYNEANIEHQAGEFGHNDYYPVVMAAALQKGNLNGKKCLKAMILLDEIRGRLAESFSLKSYKIDHVVHGAIASIVTYGTMLEASIEQIEHAIGMFVAHYIPFRAIRAGHQLSDSKGASAALSTEVAIMSMHRAMLGFIGPKDIFRNPESIFKLFKKSEKNESSFDLEVGMYGNDFSVMGMHFKLGLYEHQSAGVIQGVLDLLLKSKISNRISISEINSIKILAYEPAFGIIGDPAKRNPTTRQSADHSMVYIISTVLRKAFETPNLFEGVVSTDDLWKKLILLPKDYSPEAIQNKDTRSLMEKIVFEHGGPEFDKNYPKGIPSTVKIEVENEILDSGFIMFPAGHARNVTADLNSILNNKFQHMSKLALEESDSINFLDKMSNFEYLTAKEIKHAYSCNLKYSDKSIDA